LRDKGQDILLKVLAKDKWRQRDIEIDFFGLGINSDALKEMAKLLNVNQVRFAGFSPNVADIWRDHHALVLPSRHEGLPLAIVEAMLCGRPVITTNAGGNGEVVDDEVSGFLSQAITVDGLDDAMERAWNRRHEWQKIGATAATLIRKKVPENPTKIFTDKIVAIYDEVQKKRQP
jgi:glycosyltransferase involved in cell wall biosynthesis